MRVLIAVDGGPVSEDVITAVAALLRDGDAVDLLTVVDPGEVHSTVSGSGRMRVEQPPVRGALGATVFTTEPVPVESVTQAAARIDEEHRRQLDGFAQAHLPAPLTHAVHVRQGDRPAAVITSLATELGVDAIAVGTRARRGIVKAVLGSVAEEVVREAGRPVITIHVGG